MDYNYELILDSFFSRNNINAVHQVPFDYFWQSEHCTSFADFSTDDILFRIAEDELTSEDVEACKQNNVIVITSSDFSHMFGKPNSLESNGLKYQKKCPNPLIGVDIALFDNPEFPYREDRPKCFYDVRVDGQRSAYEAFNDESVRWKMIKNRILYSGGFIDSKQVLNALNITRTCKQPSWFSKQFAKDIITKYCTSNVIADICSGWGARADASNELHRTYIGNDFNKDLVDWHHEKGRTNIQYGDAHNFKYEGECSVFTCPPYSDPATGRCFEDYNFEGFDDSAKALSQCDWLKIAMQNIPNAKEYVMVCKVIDPGWEQFIVETKTNRSHFGNNNEYVVVVPQSMRDTVIFA